jgi:hypothetical protein
MTSHHRTFSELQISENRETLDEVKVENPTIVTTKHQ